MDVRINECNGDDFQSEAFSVVAGQIFVPYSYSDATAGVLGSMLLFIWLSASLIFAPISDRVLMCEDEMLVRVS